MKQAERLQKTRKMRFEEAAWRYLYGCVIDYLGGVAQLQPQPCNS